MVRLLSVFVVSAALSLPGFAGADPREQRMAGCDMHGMTQEHGMGMLDEGAGPGGCGGCGEAMDMPMMSGHGTGMLQQFGMLGLTQDQRSRLNKLQYDLRRQHWNLKGKVLDEQAKLYDLYAVDRPDAKKIGAVYGAIFDIRRQMIETSIDAMNRAKDILTSDQRTRLKQMQQGGGMCEGGGHHEAMHGMMSGSTGTK